MAKNKKAETKPVAVQTSELVANCDHPLTIRQIERMIFTIRGVQVIVDRDLATLYGVETNKGQGTGTCHTPALRDKMDIFNVKRGGHELAAPTFVAQYFSPFYVFKIKS
ncbi:MAG: hypothetical protein ACSW8I_10020 [bacterium]